MDNKIYNVTVKGKHSVGGELIFNLSRDGKLLGSVNKKLDADMKIILTKDKYTMSSILPDYYKMKEIYVKDLDISELDSMQEMFCGAMALEKIDLSSFDTKNITNMRCLFLNCYRLSDINLSGLDTGKVGTMCDMLSNTNISSIDISNFKTDSLIDMTRMFKSCCELTSVRLPKITAQNKGLSMEEMFFGCSKLTSIDFSNIDTSSVKYMGSMFKFCQKLTTISGVIDMKSCLNFEYMFFECPKISGLKIKNPPEEFMTFNSAGYNKAYLNAKQFEVVE